MTGEETGLKPAQGGVEQREARHTRIFPLDGVTWMVSHSPSSGVWQNIRRAASLAHSPKPCCPEIYLRPEIGHVGRDAFMAKLSCSDHSLTGTHSHYLNLHAHKKGYSSKITSEA